MNYDTDSPQLSHICVNAWKQHLLQDESPFLNWDIDHLDFFGHWKSFTYGYTNGLQGDIIAKIVIVEAEMPGLRMSLPKPFYMVVPYMMSYPSITFSTTVKNLFVLCIGRCFVLILPNTYIYIYVIRSGYPFFVISSQTQSKRPKLNIFIP